MGEETQRGERRRDLDEAAGLWVGEWPVALGEWPPPVCDRRLRLATTSAPSPLCPWTPCPWPVLVCFHIPPWAGKSALCIQQVLKKCLTDAHFPRGSFSLNAPLCLSGSQAFSCQPPSSAPLPPSLCVSSVTTRSAHRASTPAMKVGASGLGHQGLACEVGMALGRTALFSVAEKGCFKFRAPPS